MNDKTATTQSAGERNGFAPENIMRGKDGKYRWSYEMSLYSQPWIFFLVWKVLMLTLGILFAVGLLIGAWERAFWWGGFLSMAKGFGIGAAGMTVLAALGYLVYAAMMGGKYCVEFTMDGKGVEHRQTERQARKARKAGLASALLSAGRPGMAGAGLLATRTSMYSSFAEVKKVTALPKRNTIKLDAPFNHNQVYASGKDFDWVLAYIKEHCNA